VLLTQLAFDCFNRRAHRGGIFFFGEIRQWFVAKFSWHSFPSIFILKKLRILLFPRLQPGDYQIPQTVWCVASLYTIPVPRQVEMSPAPSVRGCTENCWRDLVSVHSAISREMFVEANSTSPGSWLSCSR